MTAADDRLVRYPRDDIADQPPLLFPPYKATLARAPRQALVPVDHTPTETTAPTRFPGVAIGADDLTARHAGPPIGERIIVAGRVLDADGAPVAGALVEVWQANAAGRYVHPGDTRPAPEDPNFTGVGACLTDELGSYRFTTIRPGSYPGRSHHNAWRPAHIHIAVLGRALATRLVTQLYFPGDPLLAYDPIFLAVPAAARHRLIAALDFDVTEPDVALGYRFDIVVRGRRATPAEARA